MRKQTRRRKDVRRSAARVPRIDTARYAPLGCEGVARGGCARSVIMATGGWRKPSMLRRYAIVSSADQRAAVEMLERARAEKAVSPNLALISPEGSQTEAENAKAKVQ